MQIIFGAVLAAMVVLNLFMGFVIYQIVLITNRQVKRHVTKELENCTAAVDQKMEEFKQMEQKKEKLQHEISSLEGVVLSLKTSPFYAPKAIDRELFIPTARYIDNTFFDNHKVVSDMMKGVDQREIVRNIRKLHAYTGNREDYDTACRLLDFLAVDTAYELCTVTPKLQIETLREALTGREAEMLEEFLRTLGEDEEFDALNFRTYLREIRTEQDPTMYIRTGDRELDCSQWGQEMVHQYDGNISEGLKVIYQNQSFDFSIYRLRSKK